MLDRDRLETLLAPVVEAMGYELADLEYRSGGRAALLRLFIDNAQGIGLDDCAAVSNQVSGVLDVEDPIAGEYTLEVSSPGLDRRLRTAEHFRRFEGHEVKVQLLAPQDGRRRYRGTVESVAADGRSVDVKVDGRMYTLPLAAIETARLVPVL